MAMGVSYIWVETSGEFPLRSELGERVIALVSLHHCPGACLAGTPASTAAPARSEAQASTGGWTNSRGVPEWIGNAAPVVAALVALAALLVSIWASRRGARRREFELLLERSDQ